MDFMSYAKTVKDEMEVYLYMEERGIGINHPKYWISRLEVLRQMGQYIQLIKLIRTLKNDPNIEQ